MHARETRRGLQQVTLTLQRSCDLGRKPKEEPEMASCVCFTILFGGIAATTSSCTWCEDVDPRRCARPRTTRR